MRNPSVVPIVTATVLLCAYAPVTWAAPPAQPAARASIFTGLQNGLVFRGSDRGSGWQEADTGLPSNVDVTALAVAPDARGTVYAGTSGDGVYVTTDNGRDWQDDNGGQPALSGAEVHGLVVDPQDSRVVYVVTGDGTLFRSTNGGGRWTDQSLPVGSALTSLAIDTGRPGTLFVGTLEDGVLISTDRGGTWNAPANGIPGSSVVNALVANPHDAQVAFAATGDGIWQTIDGGASWQPERRGILAGTDLQAVTMDPRNSSHVVAGSIDGQVFRSVDGGSSWQAVDATGGRQINALIYDPTQPDHLLAGTTDGSAVYDSTDGGATWQREDFPGFGEQNGVLCFTAAGRQPLPTDPVPPPEGTPSGVRYFASSQHSVRDTFLQFYDRYGGLKIFGLPLTEAFVEQGHLVQYFERVRLVWRDNQVQVSPLGSWLTAGRRFPPIVPFVSTSRHLYLPGAHHSLSGRFLTFWLHHTGGLLFGLPISEPLYEQNGDGTGRRYLVQYFQDARMEYHPELSGTNFEVSLGLLGRQILRQRGWL